LRLHPQAALKSLEKVFVYHFGKDELYEIDDSARDFLSRCNGTSRGEELTSDSEFVRYCLEEGLLELLPRPQPTDVSVSPGVTPSLRYLELQLLHRCNLKCLHCYLGSTRCSDMPLADALHIVRQFAEIGGLMLIISGGEPLLYEGLQTFISQTGNLRLRRVLLSNGTLINSRNIAWLDVEEIQFSLDGWTKGHDMLRGRGSFENTMQGIHAAKEAGMSVSFATMIHRGNLDEFDRMRDFMERIGAVEWGIDLPVRAGSLKNHPGLLVHYEEAAAFMRYAYGGGYHGSSDGYACGRHLMTVLPEGQAVKCGFYREETLGDARNGLKGCWLGLEHIPVSRLECRGCPVLAECAGGCRFRAASPLAPDPVMCALYGLPNRESFPPATDNP
ncbi:MAG: radical SAM protein, partial [Pseudomonadota bacterium]